MSEALYKLVIRKCEKGKLHSSFKDNTWDADLADTQIIIKFNIVIRFLLCVIDIFSKYAWVVSVRYYSCTRF